MVLFGELDYGTLQPHCGNENDICTQVKLQAVAKFLFMQLFTKNKDGKGCSIRNRTKAKGLNCSAMSAHEAFRV